MSRNLCPGIDVLESISLVLQKQLVDKDGPRFGAVLRREAVGHDLDEMPVGGVDVVGEDSLGQEQGVVLADCLGADDEGAEVNVGVLQGDRDHLRFLAVVMRLEVPRHQVFLHDVGLNLLYQLRRVHVVSIGEHEMRAATTAEQGFQSPVRDVVAVRCSIRSEGWAQRPGCAVPDLLVYLRLQVLEDAVYLQWPLVSPRVGVEHEGTDVHICVPLRQQRLQEAFQRMQLTHVSAHDHADLDGLLDRIAGVVVEHLGHREKAQALHRMADRFQPLRHGPTLRDGSVEVGQRFRELLDGHGGLLHRTFRICAVARALILQGLRQPGGPPMRREDDVVRAHPRNLSPALRSAERREEADGDEARLRAVKASDVETRGAGQQEVDASAIPAAQLSHVPLELRSQKLREARGCTERWRLAGRVGHEGSREASQVAQARHLVADEGALLEQQVQPGDVVAMRQGQRRGRLFAEVLVAQLVHKGFSRDRRSDGHLCQRHAHGVEGVDGSQGGLLRRRAEHLPVLGVFGSQRPDGANSLSCGWEHHRRRCAAHDGKGALNALVHEGSVDVLVHEPRQVAHVLHALQRFVLPLDAAGHWQHQRIGPQSCPKAGESTVGHHDATHRKHDLGVAVLLLRPVITGAPAGGDVPISAMLQELVAEPAKHVPHLLRVFRELAVHQQHVAVRGALRDGIQGDERPSHVVIHRDDEQQPILLWRRRFARPNAGHESGFGEILADAETGAEVVHGRLTAVDEHVLHVVGVQVAVSELAQFPLVPRAHHLLLQQKQHHAHIAVMHEVGRNLQIGHHAARQQVLAAQHAGLFEVDGVLAHERRRVQRVVHATHQDPRARLEPWIDAVDEQRQNQRPFLWQILECQEHIAGVAGLPWGAAQL
eukprot:scaffold726_cov262-Pinguiococcus_pyrenoidosus.AAC.11